MVNLNEEQLKKARIALYDPAKWVGMVWPKVRLYDKQVEIMESVRDNDETVVVAGNQLGKDFIAGLITLHFYCSRRPAKVITSSAGHRQLNSVLWGEIRRFIDTAEMPLPVEALSLMLRQATEKGVDPISYCQGMVTNVVENMQGHHLMRGHKGFPRTLAIFDEASAIASEFYNASDTWAHRKLIIGNPLPCSNFFYEAVERGDVPRDPKDLSKGYFVKVIQIKAQDSPNVRLGLREEELGKKPTFREVLPGVKSYSDYLKHRQLWDPVRQCVGLDAEFYKGGEILLFPPDNLNLSAQLHTDIVKRFRKIQGGRKAEAIGVDTSEGGSDETVFCVGDHYGIMEEIVLPLKDTSRIVPMAISLIKRFKIDPANMIFDLGGGGKEHADLMRRRGYKVRTISFAGRPEPPENDDDPIFKNKRAEMYYMLARAIEPPTVAEPEKHQYCIPDEFRELRRQLAPIPRKYDDEGNPVLIPKRSRGEDDECLVNLIGRSPDHADAAVLMHFGVKYPAHSGKLKGW